jgi:hypothetical protein
VGEKEEHAVGTGAGAAKHSEIHWTTPHNKIYPLPNVNQNEKACHRDSIGSEAEHYKCP